MCAQVTGGQKHVMTYAFTAVRVPGFQMENPTCCHAGLVTVICGQWENQGFDTQR